MSTDIGITLYAFKDAHDFACYYDIIGKRKDGTFVKYIDTEKIAAEYYGKDTKWSPNFENLVVLGDTICIDLYAHRDFTEKLPGEKLCTFRFTWDDKKQWFGVQKTP